MGLNGVSIRKLSRRKIKRTQIWSAVVIEMILVCNKESEKKKGKGKGKGREEKNIKHKFKFK